MITYNGIRITEQEFESISSEVDNLDIEIKATVKKSPMEKLNYRFGKGVQSECDEIAEMFESHNQSDIARSAMAIGLREIRKMIDKNPTMANGLIHIGKIRHDLFK